MRCYGSDDPPPPQIELKMLESASSLLQVCHEAKRPKLQQAVQQHQANIEELNLKIEAAKGQSKPQRLQCS